VPAGFFAVVADAGFGAGVNVAAFGFADVVLAGSGDAPSSVPVGAAAFGSSFSGPAADVGVTIAVAGPAGGSTTAAGSAEVASGADADAALRAFAVTLAPMRPIPTTAGIASTATNAAIISGRRLPSNTTVFAVPVSSGCCESRRRPGDDGIASGTDGGGP
jgi:hypothetical protein